VRRSTWHPRRLLAPWDAPHGHPCRLPQCAVFSTTHTVTGCSLKTEDNISMCRLILCDDIKAQGRLPHPGRRCNP
jgi:hypothetical protein